MLTAVIKSLFTPAHSDTQKICSAFLVLVLLHCWAWTVSYRWDAHSFYSQFVAASSAFQWELEGVLNIFMFQWFQLQNLLWLTCQNLEFLNFIARYVYKDLHKYTLTFKRELFHATKLVIDCIQTFVGFENQINMQSGVNTYCSSPQFIRNYWNKITLLLSALWSKD